VLRIEYRLRPSFPKPSGFGKHGTSNTRAENSIAGLSAYRDVSGREKGLLGKAVSSIPNAVMACAGDFEFY
jgi:hypothetical protein